MTFWRKKHIFMDYASITPQALSVSKKMRPFEMSNFSNPSALYNSAILAKSAVSRAKKDIAEVLGVTASQIYFTSSGTEGNNLAILGVFKAHKTNDFTPHFVTSVIEHPSVLEVFAEIERQGGEVTYLPVSSEGMVEPKSVSASLKENTVLVSIMYANNEIGTIQKISEIGRVIRDFRNKNKSSIPYFHTDASQAGLYLPLNVLKLHVELLTLDAIKMYGPRGEGMLFVSANVKIKPIILGGGQEKGLRSGTENVSGIVGFSEALALSEKLKDSESLRLTEIRDHAFTEILKNFKTAKINGSTTNRLPNNVNVCFPKLDAEFAVIKLDVLGISASYSSSCRTLKEDSSSYVIKSIYGDESCSLSSLRFTFGRETGKKDIDKLVLALKKVVK